MSSYFTIKVLSYTTYILNSSTISLIPLITIIKNKYPLSSTKFRIEL